MQWLRCIILQQAFDPIQTTETKAKEQFYAILSKLQLHTQEIMSARGLKLLTELLEQDNRRATAAKTALRRAAQSMKACALCLDAY